MRTVRFREKGEWETYPDEVRKAGAGLGSPVPFQEYCFDLIACHWTATEEEKALSKELAELLLNDVVPDNLFITYRSSGGSSYAIWLGFEWNGKRLGFGLNQFINIETWNKLPWKNN